MRQNGEPKLRAIDDFSRSGVNKCTAAAEKLRCDTLDGFFETMRALSGGTTVPFVPFACVLSVNWFVLVRKGAACSLES